MPNTAFPNPPCLGRRALSFNSHNDPRAVEQSGEYALGIIDKFDGNVGTGLATSDIGAVWTATGSTTAQWSEGLGVGLVTPTSAGATVRTLNMPVYHADGDWYMDFMFTSTAVGAQQVMFFYIRCQSILDLQNYGARLRVNLAPATPANLGAVIRNIGGVNTTVSASSIDIPNDVFAGTYYRIHAFMDGAFYGVNVWDPSLPEPAGWLKSWSDPGGWMDGSAISIGNQALAGNTNLSSIAFNNLNATIQAALLRTGVAFDLATVGSGLTFTHTCTGTNRYLTVEVQIASSTVTSTGVTYNGVAMTLLQRQLSGAGTTTVELWGLVNPAYGANSVVVTLSGGAGTAQGAASYSNVDQTTPQSSAQGSSGTGATANGPAQTTGASGGTIVEAIVANTFSPTAPTLQAWNDGGGDGSAYLIGTGASQQTAYTVSGSNWGIASAVLNAVGALAGISFAVPVASATAAGLTTLAVQSTHAPSVAAGTAVGVIPVVMDTRAPGVAVGTAVGPLPVVMDTRTPGVAVGTAVGVLPVVMDTRAPGVASVTAAAGAAVPAMLITFTPPEGDAVAASPVPTMEWLADAAGQPQPFIGGMQRIGVGGPILQQQTPGADPSPSVIYAVPVAAATTSGLTPVLLATFLPPKGDAVTTAPVPVLQSTHLPAVAAATSAAITNVLAATFTPAAAGTTAAGLAPTWPWMTPVGSATAAGQVPVLRDTRLPGVASASAVGQTPVSLATFAAPVASGTAVALVPSWPFTIGVASATAAGQAPVLLITFAPAEGDATAAAPVPLMSISTSVFVTQDTGMPLISVGGLRTIPGSMAILRPQEWGDPASAMLFAIPVASATTAGLTPVMLTTWQPGVASATAAGLTPVMLGTLVPGVASATAASLIPAMLATWQPGVASGTAAGQAPVMLGVMTLTVASATAAGQVPILGVTYAAPVANGTAVALVPSWGFAVVAASATASAPAAALLITFTPPVGGAVAASPAPLMAVLGQIFTTQDAFMPFWGGLRTIPGSMTILREQEWGEPATATLFAIPVANLTAASVAPTLLDTYAAVTAAATAAGLTPVQQGRVLPGVAAALAAGQAPAVLMTYVSAVASATSAGLTPVQAATYGITVASAVAAGLVPSLPTRMLPGVASATAVANTPVYQAAYLPLTPSATATGLVPAWRVTFIPGVATVTAVAFVVVFDVGVAGGHTIYAITGRTTRTSIANITLSGTASTTTQDAQSIGGGQASTGRTDADGTIDP